MVTVRCAQERIMSYTIGTTDRKALRSRPDDEGLRLEAIESKDRIFREADTSYTALRAIYVIFNTEEPHLEAYIAPFSR